MVVGQQINVRTQLIAKRIIRRFVPGLVVSCANCHAILLIVSPRIPGTFFHGERHYSYDSFYPGMWELAKETVGYGGGRWRRRQAL